MATSHFEALVVIWDFFFSHTRIFWQRCFASINRMAQVIRHSCNHFPFFLFSSLYFSFILHSVSLFDLIFVLTLTRVAPSPHHSCAGHMYTSTFPQSLPHTPVRIILFSFCLHP
ncbi:hypothetical protein BDV32DRAFT_35692 [Aspergillus pseudonomiae]|uniref:Uncharacterized protein n=1 Tax=Aspergillus pseudonomiae TaxID=1506151 RepID=A0A5N7D3S6_9EURO|nr:uncharacterized protein BDV37DRAFT_188301 [Aspergillus pseudonomiae]KAB8265799.1 hypothetical protein BDV32DRAFT_35692 [Aspergillus pseudonomiae]KAE8401055.1 hypothetical protein BDV37DRAFT_188301 [Aspergillus pseudonomiae]